LSGTPSLGSVGSYPITITASNGIGTDASQSFSLIVEKLAPTFSALTASQSIVYGTASIALAGTVNGYATIGGSVTVTIAGTTVGPLVLADGSNAFDVAAFDTHALTVSGSPYTITYTYSGDDNAQPANDTSTTLTITRKGASVTANSRSKTYGDPVTFDGTEFTSAGFINGDAVTSVTLTSDGADAAASVAGGPYAIVSSAAVGHGLDNYTIGYGDGSLSVTPRPASVTPNAATKIYGEDDPTLNGALSGFLEADAVSASYSRTSGESVAGSPYVISATLNPAGVLDNYSINYGQANFTITPRPASVTPNAATKVYGDDDPALSGALSGFLAADAVTPSYSRTSGESVAGSPYVISATLSPAGVLVNYSINYGHANFTITARPVTVVADPQSKTYGDDDPALTYHITHGSLAFSDTFTGALSRQPGEAVGSYAILPGSLELSAIAQRSAGMLDSVLKFATWHLA